MGAVKGTLKVGRDAAAGGALAGAAALVAFPAALILKGFGIGGALTALTGATGAITSAIGGAGVLGAIMATPMLAPITLFVGAIAAGAALFAGIGIMKRAIGAIFGGGASQEDKMMKSLMKKGVSADVAAELVYDRGVGGQGRGQSGGRGGSRSGAMSRGMNAIQDNPLGAIAVGAFGTWVTHKLFGLFDKGLGSAAGAASNAWQGRRGNSAAQQGQPAAAASATPPPTPAQAPAPAPAPQAAAPQPVPTANPAATPAPVAAAPAAATQTVPSTATPAPVAAAPTAPTPAQNPVTPNIDGFTPGVPGSLANSYLDPMQVLREASERAGEPNHWKSDWQKARESTRGEAESAVHAPVAPSAAPPTAGQAVDTLVDRAEAQRAAVKSEDAAIARGKAKDAGVPDWAQGFLGDALEVGKGLRDATKAPNSAVNANNIVGNTLSADQDKEVAAARVNLNRVLDGLNGAGDLAEMLAAKPKTTDAAAASAVDVGGGQKAPPPAARVPTAPQVRGVG